MEEPGVDELGRGYGKELRKEGLRIEGCWDGGMEDNFRNGFIRQFSERKEGYSGGGVEAEEGIME